MKRETWSIVVACALGALIGTLSALDIAARFKYGSYMWGAGALLGGMIAYVVVDFRRFCAGVARSYRETLAWRPNRLYWRAWFAMWVAMCSMVATCPIFIGLALIGAYYLEYPLEHSMKPLTLDTLLSKIYYGYVDLWPTIWLVFGLFLAFTTSLAFTAVQRGNYFEAEYEDKLRSARNHGYKIALNMSPFGVIFWMMYGIVWAVVHSPRFVVEAAKFIVSIAVLLAQFVARVFVYVHSSRRTLCFVGATLAATIGYAFGSAIIGAVAGIVLGVISYEIVSVRWLRLVPQTSR